MVFGVLKDRARAAIAHAATAARIAVLEALRPAPMVRGLTHDLFRSRSELLAENAMLRQQLVVTSRKVKQPKLRPLERGLVVALSGGVKSWQSAIPLVKPDTVLRWHRDGFRLLWRPMSKATKRRQPRGGEGPQFIIRHRDDELGAEFDRAAQGVGMKVVRTAVKAPLMNSMMERYVGSARREALDHVIVLGERHLRSGLDEHSFRHFNAMRPRQGIGRRIPVSTPRQACNDASKVVAIPVLGGLHHDYRAAA